MLAPDNCSANMPVFNCLISVSGVYFYLLTLAHVVSSINHQ